MRWVCILGPHSHLWSPAVLMKNNASRTAGLNLQSQGLQTHPPQQSRQFLTVSCHSFHPNMGQENQDPSYVSIIIEGKEVLEDCRSVANAGLLMGVIYAVNLCYPLKHKYTYEVFQKLFLELDILKMSLKVQALHKQLPVCLQCFESLCLCSTKEMFCLFVCWFFFFAFPVSGHNNPLPNSNSWVLLCSKI